MEMTIGYESILAVPLAQAGAPAAQGPSTGLFVGYMVLIALFFYFLIVRPQQKKEKERQSLMKAIQTGDRIVFGGGILGIVSNIKEHTLVVKIDNNVKVEIVKEAVTKVVEKGAKASGSEEK